VVAPEAKREGFALVLERVAAEIGRKTKIIEIARFQRQERRGRRTAGARFRTIDRMIFVTRYGFAIITPVSGWTVQTLNVGRNRLEEVGDGLKRAVFSHWLNPIPMPKKSIFRRIRNQHSHHP
jgi:hypothetical protein